MSSDIRPWSAMGERVRVDTITEADIPEYRRAVQQSVERIRPWNPVNPGDLPFHLERQSDVHRTFLIRALPEERIGDHSIVGKVNLTGITRGRALAGMLGYDAYDPYAGRGLFAEGLRLVVDIAFAPAPAGAALNRVEAAVQPGNVRSAGLLRSIGFRRRGEYPSYLWLGDANGHDAWRDHVVYGVRRADWPTAAYAVHTYDAPVVVVATGTHGTSGEAHSLDEAAARALALEVGVPLLRAGASMGEEDLQRVDDAVTGAVVLATHGPAEALAAHLGRPLVDAADLTTPAAVTRVALSVRASAHR